MLRIFNDISSTGCLFTASLKRNDANNLLSLQIDFQIVYLNKEDLLNLGHCIYAIANCRIFWRKLNCLVILR